MAEEDVTRRLAAIFYADVAGYSRLTCADEAGTHRALGASLDALCAAVEDHGGRVVHFAGDAVLAEFASVVAAVRCAVAVQRDMAARDRDVAEERRLRFRIGLNLGEVIVDRDDIYGDGVNVAARLESLADAGGICVSGAVHDQVHGKLDLSFEDMGAQSVKNIAAPLRAYRVRLDDAAANRVAATAPAERPSIAVLPFANMSGDPDQEYFADGVTEDIITALSKIRWFSIIARNSTFAYKGQSTDIRQVAAELGVRYVLEGSVRKAGNRVRITAQLIDGSTGKHVWAERYDRALEDVFALQDELTETIVGAIEPELSREERRRATNKRPDNLDAWDEYQRGLAHLYLATKEGLAEAERHFRRAIAMDPGLGPAHAGSAEGRYLGLVYGHSDAPGEDREEALKAARRALELDGADAAAHCMLGRVHSLRREHAEAIPELEAALALNPSLASAHYGIGAAFAFSGRARDAFPHLENAIRLSPRDPHMGSFLVRMADAHLFTGAYEEAVEWARKALRQPNFQWSRHAVLISALGHLGRQDEARRALDELLRQRADFSVRFVRETHLISDPEDLAHYIDGLHKAGVAK